MPWRPLPKIASAIATSPFKTESPEDLPLELGDELYIIEEGGKDWAWFRGWLVTPPSLLAGLTSEKGAALQARVYSGIFPRSHVTIKEWFAKPESPVESAVGLNTLTAVTEQPLAETAVNSEAVHSLAEQQSGNDQRESEDGASEASSSHNSEDSQLEIKPKKKFPRLSATEAISDGTKPTSLSSVDSANNQARAKPAAPVPMLKIGDETEASQGEPLIDEIASCLREWHSTYLHVLSLAGRYEDLDKLESIGKSLNLARSQLIHNVLTEHELVGLRERTVWDLVTGNKMLADEVIVRDPNQRGRLLTGDDDPYAISELQSTMSLLEQPPVLSVDQIKLHHILFEMKDVSGFDKDKTTILVTLYTVKPDMTPMPLSETFSMEVPSKEGSHKSHLSKMRTLFTDLSAIDVGETSSTDMRLFLVVRAQIQVPHEGESVDASKMSTITSAHPESISVTLNHNTLKGRRSVLWPQNKFGSQRNKMTPPRSTMSGETRSAESLSEHNKSPRSSESQSSSNASRSSNISRDVGIGVLDLRNFIREDQQRDEILSLMTPVDAQREVVGSDDVLSGFLKHFYHSSTEHYDTSRLISPIKFRLHSLVELDADTLIRRRPTILLNVPKTPKVGFSGAPKKPRSDIYLTLSRPNFPGQALYSHPVKGAVPIPNISSIRNLTLTMEVRRSSGERVTGCIFPFSNSSAHTAWRTAAIPRNGTWEQTLRLVIPKDEVHDCHVIMSLADGINFPFALSWMPLWHDGAFVQDGAHHLLLHHFDKTTVNPDAGTFGYLNLPWNSKAKSMFPRESWSDHMSIVKVDSFLCSTLFSQDQTLLGLLKWKEYPDDEVLILLRQMAQVPDIEIVKRLGDTLDALFGLMVGKPEDDEFEDLAFNSLVTVLSIVHDRRFHIEQAIDDYIQRRFEYPFVAPCLIRSYLRLLARRVDFQNSRRLRTALKVGRQIIKFIVTARLQQKAREENIGIHTDDIFDTQFKKIFDSLEDQMRESSPQVIGSKTLIVQHIHTWFPEMEACFSQEDILAIATSFIDSCAKVNGKLVLHKLVLIWNLAKVFRTFKPELRIIIEQRTENWIAPYWGLNPDPDEQFRDQVRMCCSIVALRGSDYGSQIPAYYSKVIQSYHCIDKMIRPKGGYLSLLFPSTYPFPSRSTSAARDYDECLIELAAVKATFRAEDLLKNYSKGPTKQVDLMTMALEVNLSIMRGKAFPKTWLSLHVYHHRVIFELLDFGFKLMSQELLPAPEDADKFPTELWKTLLTTLLELVSSESLALEYLPEQKRRAVWKIVGGIRESGANLLRRIWDTLGWETDEDEKKQYRLSRSGGYQVQYVPSLVGPILELCLSFDDNLRTVSTEILKSMIVSEWTLNEDLSVIHTEMIYALDSLFKTKNVVDNGQQRLFVDQLQEMFKPSPDPPASQFCHTANGLVASIDELLDLLVAVHAPDQHESLRMMNTLRLMEYLRGLQKEDIFIAYVHQLAVVEAEAQNFREAGLAMGLHAALYTWDLDAMVDELPNPSLPRQSAFERKEALYFQMINHFEQGGAWSCALEYYRELAEQYEHKNFDFAKLARTQRAIAKILDLVARGEGDTSRYFRVVFRGLGFPTMLRDKAFIYEGNGSERLTAFTDRLQQQHPAASIVSHYEEESPEGQFLDITVVTPYHQFQHPVYRRPKVLITTKEFLTHAKPNKFGLTSKRHSPKTGTQNQWVEKTIYQTADKFPTILRRSEIIKEHDVSLSPLETAIDRTFRKTLEMNIMHKRIQEGDTKSIATMIDAIKGSVDPNSSVSVAEYRNLMYKHQKQSTVGSKEDPKVNTLQTALLDYATELRTCIAELGKTSHQLEHKNFSILFQSAFGPELDLLNQMVPSAATASLLSPEMDQYSLHLSNDHAEAFEAISITNPSTATGLPGRGSSHREAGLGRFNNLLRRRNGASSPERPSFSTDDTSERAPAPNVPTYRNRQGSEDEWATLTTRAPSRTSGPNDSLSALPRRSNSRQSRQRSQSGPDRENQLDRNARPNTSGTAARPMTSSTAASTALRPSTATGGERIALRNGAASKGVRKRFSSLGFGRKTSKRVEPAVGNVEEE